MAAEREVKKRRRENRVDVALIVFWLVVAIVAAASANRAGRSPAFQGEPQWFDSHDSRRH